MPEAFCEFETARKKALLTLWALWEKKIPSVKERTPQRFVCVTSHSEGALYFSQKNTEKQNIQRCTETLSQPITQSVTANRNLTYSPYSSQQAHGGWNRALLEDERGAMKDGRGYSRTCGGGTDSPAEDGWFARRGAWLTRLLGGRWTRAHADEDNRKGITPLNSAISTSHNNGGWSRRYPWRRADNAYARWLRDSRNDAHWPCVW